MPQQKSKASTTEKAPEKAPKKAARLSFEAVESRNPDRKLVPGSLRFEADGTHANKQTVEIVCGSPGCKAVRRIATSDAFQVGLCVPCTAEARKARRSQFQFRSTHLL